MKLSEEENDANMKLSQLKNIMSKDYNNTAGYIKEILKTGYEINSIIKSTPHLESKKPELIGCTALHLAFMENCTEGFETLIKAGADYIIKNRNGLTVLHQILENFYRYKSMLRLNSEFSISIMSVHSNNLTNPCTSYGLSHFHAACLCNNADLVKSFLESGVSVDDTVKMDSPCFPGYTPLHFAVRSYGFETVQVLLEKGANQNLENADKKTPLLMLTEQKIKLMSSPDTSIMVPDSQLDDALVEHERITQLLYNNNDCINFSAFHLACTMKDTTLLKNMLENGVDVNLVVNQTLLLWPGFTGLHFAALCNFENVMLLLKKGANIEAKNAAGVTAFDLCLNLYKPEQISKILSVVDIWKDIVLSDNETTLVELVEVMSNPEQFEAFLDNSAGLVTAIIPADSVLWPGYTILHVAVQLFTADVAIVKTCLKANADVSAQSANGSSALHLAFRKEQKVLVHLLLQHHREQLSNLTDDENLSVLHIACSMKGHEEFAKRLIQSAPDMNLAYKGNSIGSSLRSGFTPLHVAVVSGNDKFVMELLQRGANRYAADSDGFTPMHWVLAAPNPDTIGNEFFVSVSDVQESIVSGLSHLHVASYIESRMLKDFRHVDSYKFRKLLLELPETNANTTVIFNESTSPKFLSKLAGVTPLNLAVQKKNWDALDALEPFAEQPNGSTPLYDVLNLAERFYEARPLIMKFMNDIEAQRSARRDTGLTMLHLACYLRDVDMIKSLTSNDEDPNAQIHMDSPVWPGCTPLHILVKYDAFCHEITRSLGELELVFDFTLKNADGDTALHLAYKYERQLWLRDLFRRHHNYNVNPVNNAGLSYFHIACSVMDCAMVENFLNAGVDVDSFVDPFFSESSVAGQSPLHLILNPKRFYNDNDLALDAIFGMLLQRGARVDAKDALGETALHKAVKLGKMSYEVLKKVIEAGADVNALDMFCTDPWDLLLSIGNFSTEQLELFIEKGCRLNGFSPANNDGYASLVFCQHKSESIEKMILFNAILNHPKTIDTDENDCTVVHSFVANSVTTLSSDEYAKIVEQLLVLSDNECDIDDRDKHGRTALHVAVYHGNDSAIAGLLIAGADVNVADNDGYLAFDYLSEEGSDDESTVIAKHIKKLEILKLTASLKNRDFAASIFEQLDLDVSSLEVSLRAEFELAKSVDIPVGSLNLQNFLTETYSDTTIHALIGDETGTSIKRFFRDFKDERFVELRSILKLQYRKALARSRLIEGASDALDRMSRCSVQCARLVARFWTNDELECLIEARKSIDD